MGCLFLSICYVSTSWSYIQSYQIKLSQNLFMKQKRSHQWSSGPAPLTNRHWILINEAGPQSRPVVIIVFAHVVRSSVRLHFSKQNIFQAKTMFTTSETVSLTEWIIDDSCLVCFVLLDFIKFGRTKGHVWILWSRLWL